MRKVKNIARSKFTQKITLFYICVDLNDNNNVDEGKEKRKKLEEEEEEEDQEFL